VLPRSGASTWFRWRPIASAGSWRTTEPPPSLLGEGALRLTCCAPAPLPLVIRKRVMTMSDLAVPPFNGAHRLRRAGVTGGPDTEVQAPTDEEVCWPPQAKRKRVDGGCQDSVEHGGQDARSLPDKRVRFRPSHPAAAPTVSPCRGQTTISKPAAAGRRHPRPRVGRALGDRPRPSRPDRSSHLRGRLRAGSVKGPAKTGPGLDVLAQVGYSANRPFLDETKCRGSLDD